MFNRRKAFILALSGLTLAGAVAGEFSSASGRITGFGPAVTGDPSLNASLGVLRRTIAWLNSPNGDVFQVAQASIDDESFDSVAALSDTSVVLGVWSNVRNDTTLDRSNRALSLVIAWQNSPAGDAYQVAQAPTMVKGSDFDRIALASIPQGSREF